MFAEMTFFGSCQSMLIWKLGIRFRICTKLSTTTSGRNRKLFILWEVQKNLTSSTKICQKIPKIHTLPSSSNNLNRAYCILSKFGIEMPDTCRYVIGKSEGQKRPQNINFCTFFDSLGPYLISIITKTVTRILCYLHKYISKLL